MQCDYVHLCVYVYVCRGFSSEMGMQGAGVEHGGDSQQVGGGTWLLA